MTAYMRALRPWRNLQYEGDISPGHEFHAPEHRAQELEMLGLAERVTAAVHETLYEPLDASPITSDGRRELFISIPAWGKLYVGLAVKHTIPAAVASLRAAGRTATFLIHTDDREAFAGKLGGHSAKFFLVPGEPGGDREIFVDPLPKTHWVAFMAAHREAISLTPPDAILALFNSDMVVSIETFGFVDRVLGSAGRTAKRVISILGVRTLIDGNDPPIGVNARTLNAYIWAHRHKITDDNIVGRGSSMHPTQLFFEHGHEVTMHGFHHTPMFIIKDGALMFRGTIDDDLIGKYPDDSIYFVRDCEMSFAELSFGRKRDVSGELLTVDNAVKYWAARGLSPGHARNFRQRMTILGDPEKNHPYADQIMARLRC